MGKVVWHEFVGSWLVFGVLSLFCLTIIGIPVALLYLIEHTVTVEEEMKNPSEFMDNFRAGKYRKMKGK